MYLRSKKTIEQRGNCTIYIENEITKTINSYDCAHVIQEKLKCKYFIFTILSTFEYSFFKCMFTILKYFIDK